MEITRVVTECGCRLAFPTTHVDLAPRELGEALVTGVVRRLSCLSVCLSCLSVCLSVCLSCLSCLYVPYTLPSQ